MRQEVEQAMRIVEEYSSSSPAASKESLSKEEAAATKQETIIIKESATAAEDEALKTFVQRHCGRKAGTGRRSNQKGHSRRQYNPKKLSIIT